MYEINQNPKLLIRDNMDKLLTDGGVPMHSESEIESFRKLVSVIGKQQL